MQLIRLGGKSEHQTTLSLLRFESRDHVLDENIFIVGHARNYNEKVTRRRRVIVAFCDDNQRSAEFILNLHLTPVTLTKSDIHNTGNERMINILCNE